MTEPRLLARFWARFGFFSYLALPQTLVLGVALLGFGKYLESTLYQNATAYVDDTLENKVVYFQQSLDDYFSNEQRLPVITGQNDSTVLSGWYQSVRDSSHAVNAIVMVLDAQGHPLFTDRILPLRLLVPDSGVYPARLLMADGHHADVRVLRSERVTPDGRGGVYRIAVAIDASMARSFSESQNRGILVILALFFMVTLMLELLLIKQLLNPLKRLSDRMKVIGPETWGSTEPIDALPKELIQLSERFNSLLARLRKAFEERQGFTEDLAHQLRTPLTVLQMQLETFRRRPRGPEEYEQLVEDMGDGVDRLNQVIDSLLMVSRYESLAQLPDIEDVDLSELVMDLVELFTPFAEENELHFRLALTPGVRLRGNGRILRQAISNLMDNALKYGTGGVYIDLQVHKTREKAIFSIVNYGPLIPTDQLTKIYDRFFRSESTKATRGYGLGLAIVKQIVTLHGGRIETISDEQHGTRFSLVFPLLD